MKILVIDDERRNQVSALTTLVDHDVTVARGAKEGFERLGEGTAWDAVLTDLFMPADLELRSLPRDRKPTGELPIGVVFAMMAVNLGIRTVICTDADHHQDALACLLVDKMPGEGPRVAVVEARVACVEGIWDAASETIVPSTDWEALGKAPSVKDWHRAMKISRLFPAEIGMFPKDDVL